VNIYCRSNARLIWAHRWLVNESKADAMRMAGTQYFISVKIV